MNRREYLATWSKIHGFADGSEISGVARIYLGLNFYLVQPFLFLRMSPNVVTLLAPVLASAALVVEGNLWIALCVLASLLVDGFDGAVAIISGKNSRLGAVWDGIIDRVTELLWIGALYYGGISPAILLVIWVLVATQEYGRAKLAHVAGNVLGVVTICERPVRGLLVAFGFLGQIYYSNCLDVIAIIWLVLQAIAVIQFMSMARKQLH